MKDNKQIPVSLNSCATELTINDSVPRLQVFSNTDVKYLCVSVLCKVCLAFTVNIHSFANYESFAGNRLAAWCAAEVKRSATLQGMTVQLL